MNNRQVPGGTPLPRGPHDGAAASWLVLTGRWLLLLIAAGAVVVAFTLADRRDRASSVQTRYVCPMHAEVVSNAPGECSICRMELERVGTEDPEPTSIDAVLDTAKKQVVAREVRAPAWLEETGQVTAIFYKDELPGLAPGTRGQFFPAVAPGAPVDVRLSARPAAPRDTSTSRVRFDVAAAAPGRRTSAAGWVKLVEKPHELLVIPPSAVLRSSEGSYVLVTTDGRTLAKRFLDIGRISGGFAAVLSGLEDGERVVVGNTFFLDAHRRLNP